MNESNEKAFYRWVHPADAVHQLGKFFKWRLHSDVQLLYYYLRNNFTMQIIVSPKNTVTILRQIGLATFIN